MGQTTQTESKNKAPLSRRQFGTVAGVAAVAAGTPVAAIASGSTGVGDVAERAVSLSSPSGPLNGFFVHPAKGAHPAVLSWRDGSGFGVTNRADARRLAKQGYSVLVLDRDPADPDPIEVDAREAVSWLESQPNVDDKIGVGTPEWAKHRLETQRHF